LEGRLLPGRRDRPPRRPEHPAAAGADAAGDGAQPAALPREDPGARRRLRRQCPDAAPRPAARRALARAAPRAGGGHRDPARGARDLARADRPAPARAPGPPLAPDRSGAGRRRVSAAPVELLRRIAMTGLRPLEAALVARGAREAEAAPPPVFVVGPPRSGTTLVYQLLVRRFRVAYLSNLAHRLYETPAAATWLGRPFVRPWTGPFESRYGHV